jgi:acyl-CoA thioesterase I
MPVEQKFMNRRWARTRIGFVALVLLAACASGKFDALPAGAKVLVVGDSITAGYGLAPEQAWTARLASETGWQVVNAGISGDTTAGGVERLPALLDEHRPAAVIIELGGNDMLRRQAPTAIVANLESMLVEIERRGARPILMSIPKPELAGIFFASLSDAPFYAEIGERKRIPLIANVLAKVLAKPELKLDRLHPNSSGQQEIGKEAASTLRKQGLVR